MSEVSNSDVETSNSTHPTESSENMSPEEATFNKLKAIEEAMSIEGSENEDPSPSDSSDVDMVSGSDLEGKRSGDSKADTEIPQENTPEEEGTTPTILLHTKDGETAVPENAELQVKIDGRMEKVKLKDFMNGISGEVAIARKFSALNVQKQELSKQKEFWDSGKAKFDELMSAGNVKDSLALVLSMGGYDPQDVFTGLAREIMPTVQQLMQMTPEQQREYQLSMEKQAYQKKLETAQAEMQSLQATQEQAKRIKQVQQLHNLNDSAFVEYYDGLMSEIQNGTIPFQGEVTPELVGEYAQLNEFKSMATKALENTVPNLAKNHRIVLEFAVEARKLYEKGYQIDQGVFQKLVDGIYTKEAAQKTKVNQTNQNKKVSMEKRGSEPWYIRMEQELKQSRDPAQVFEKWK